MLALDDKPFDDEDDEDELVSAAQAPSVASKAVHRNLTKAQSVDVDPSFS